MGIIDDIDAEIANEVLKRSGPKKQHFGTPLFRELGYKRLKDVKLRKVIWCRCCNKEIKWPDVVNHGSRKYCRKCYYEIIRRPNGNN